MKISVVIPLFNKRDFIGDAITSVLEQDVDTAIEIIVIDDGSTDGGPNVVREHFSERVLLITQANAGVSAARNVGLDVAQGELIAFLDADDFWLPHHLQKLIALHRDYPDAAAVATGYFRTAKQGRSNGGPNSMQRAPRRGLVHRFYSSWSQGNFFFTSSIAVVTHWAAKAQLRFPLGEKLGEDQELWFQIAERGRIAYDPSITVGYRVAVAQSAMSKGPEPDLLPCIQRLEHRLLARHIPAHERAGAYKVVATHRLNGARIWIARGQHGRAIEMLRSRMVLFKPRYLVKVMLEGCLKLPVLVKRAY